MKILFFCPSKFDLNSQKNNSLGGVEALNLALSTILAKKGYKITLSTDCKNITKKKNLINLPISEIISKSKKYQFDYIISSNEPSVYKYYNNSKKIFWMHNTLALEKAVRKKKLFALLRSKITTIFVSKYLKNITSKLYFFNKRIVIPNFLLPEYTKKKINNHRNKNVIWSVQRKRGLKETIEMWIKYIYPNNKNAKFFIFAVEKDKSLKSIKFYNKYNIFFFGRVSKKKLNNIYNKSSITICLGYDETFCLNAIEANACGLPIITFGKTALNEIVKHNYNGFIVDNFKEMAITLNKYLNLDNDQLNRYAYNSFNYSKKYTLNKIVNYWIKLLK